MPLYAAFQSSGNAYEHTGTYTTLETAIEDSGIDKETLRMRIDNIWVGTTSEGQEITIVQISRDQYQIYLDEDEKER